VRDLSAALGIDEHHDFAVAYTLIVANARGAGLTVTVSAIGYAGADQDLKRRPCRGVPDVPAPARRGHLLIDGADLVDWLRRM
jgi:hypothetical protein